MEHVRLARSRASSYIRNLSFVVSSSFVSSGLGLTSLRMCHRYLFLLPISIFSGFKLIDNNDNSKNGVARNITIVNDKQIEISFTGWLQSSIDNIYDLVNDPQKTIVLNDTTEPKRSVLTNETARSGIFADVD